jgi:hypothetical protein
MAVALVAARLGTEGEAVTDQGAVLHEVKMCLRTWGDMQKSPESGMVVQSCAGAPLLGVPV